MKNMKRKYVNNILACCAVSLGLSACTDVWGEHYQANKPISEQIASADDNLWELIESDTTLTEFAALLRKVRSTSNKMRYDSLLMMNRSYTVWAPVDGTGFIDTTLLAQATDEELEVYAKRIVENHIANFVHTAGGIRDKEDKKNYEMVEMLNLKKYDFEGPQAGAYTFAGKDLAESNIVAKNGMLHKVDGYVDFVANIWEQLAEEAKAVEEEKSVSKLWDFLSKDFKREFNPNNSVQGPIKNGQVTWLDSAFTEDCRWWHEIGYLNREDSSYTMYALNNAAWDEMYEMTRKYFVYPQTMKTSATKGSLNAEEAADSIVKEFMCRNLVFSNTVNKKYFNEERDTLRSTRNQIFEGDEARALTDASMNGQVGEGISLSNGTLNIVSQVNYNPFTCWHDTLRVEGESLEEKTDDDDKRFGYTNARRDMESKERIHRDSLLYNVVSGHAIGIFNAAPMIGEDPEFNFYFNNVLSAWYRIKIVLLPCDIVDPSDTTFVKPNKFKAYLRGNDVDGTPYLKQLLCEDGSESWVSDVTMVDTIVLCDAIYIPTCEYEYNGLTNEESSWCLQIVNAIKWGKKVMNRVTRNDAYGEKNEGNWDYDNSFRIDQVILEPIEAPEETPENPSEESVGE